MKGEVYVSAMKVKHRFAQSDKRWRIIEEINPSDIIYLEWSYSW